MVFLIFLLLTALSAAAADEGESSKAHLHGRLSAKKLLFDCVFSDFRLKFVHCSFYSVPDLCGYMRLTLQLFPPSFSSDGVLLFDGGPSEISVNAVETTLSLSLSYVVLTPEGIS